MCGKNENLREKFDRKEKKKKEKWKWRNNNIEEIQIFKYLGFTFNRNGNIRII